MTAQTHCYRGLDVVLVIEPYLPLCSPTCAPSGGVVQISQKTMWRTGHIDCPDACTIETPWEDCKCTCSDAAMEGKPSAEVCAYVHLPCGICTPGWWFFLAVPYRAPPWLSSRPRLLKASCAAAFRNPSCLCPFLLILCLDGKNKRQPCTSVSQDA